MDGAEIAQRMGLWALISIPILFVLIPDALASGLILVGTITLSGLCMLAALLLVHFAGHDLSRARTMTAIVFCLIATLVGIVFGVNATPRWIAGMAFGYGMAGVFGFGIWTGVQAYRYP